MNIDEALKIIDEVLDTGKDSGSKSPILDGMKLLQKRGVSDYDMGAAHDQIWYGDFKETVSKMLPTEIRYMADRGWFESDGSWTHLV